MESEEREALLKQNCWGLGTNWIWGFEGEGEGCMGDNECIQEGAETMISIWFC